LVQLQVQHEFHSLLVQSAGNQTVTVLHGAIQRILDAADRQRAVTAGTQAARALHEGARAHRRLLELLEVGDAPRAEALWRRHIDATTEYQVRTATTPIVLDLT
jgi:DNA-binding GntR family transcriptional regulator